MNSTLPDVLDIAGLTIDGGNNGITISGEKKVGVLRTPGSGGLTLKNLTVANGSSSGGGGVYNFRGTLTVINSTFSGNSGSNGGGIYNGGKLTVINSTFSGNSAFSGSDIFSNSDTTTLSNTIVADSKGGGCFGTIVDDGYNIDNDGSCNFSGTSKSKTDPKLDPNGLQNNGGPTQTIALVPGSPAIDAIPTGTNGCGTTIKTDQRGVTRPQGPKCDIGAFEAPLNSPPTATGDTYSTDEDHTLTVSAADGVLKNDTDPDKSRGDTLKAVKASDPSSGTLTLNDDGSFTYTPNKDFNGTDSFTYKASDSSKADSDPATVTLTVKPINDAPVARDDSATTDEDTATPAIDVLSNDSDVDGDILSVGSFTNGSHGTVTKSTDGTKLTYTPEANFNGTDTFTYKANDGSLDSNAATVTITVKPVSGPPSNPPPPVSSPPPPASPPPPPPPPSKGGKHGKGHKHGGHHKH